MAKTMNQLLSDASDALASLEESREAYAAACAVEEESGTLDPDAYEAWEDSVMDTHLDELSSALSALVEALRARDIHNRTIERTTDAS